MDFPTAKPAWAATQALGLSSLGSDTNLNSSVRALNGAREDQIHSHGVDEPGSLVVHQRGGLHLVSATHLTPTLANLIGKNQFNPVGDQNIP